MKIIRIITGWKQGQFVAIPITDRSLDSYYRAKVFGETILALDYVRVKQVRIPKQFAHQFHGEHQTNANLPEQMPMRQTA